MIVSSDPRAFLRPIYRRLAPERAFHLLAEPLQFDRLVEAAAEVSERHAALMREYTPLAKAAILRHLAKAESLRPGAKQVQLWTLKKGAHPVCGVSFWLTPAAPIPAPGTNACGKVARFGFCHSEQPAAESAN
jgi:hypothetical protein